MDDKQQLIHNATEALAYLKMCVGELRDLGVETLVVAYERDGQRLGVGSRFDLLFSEAE